MLPTPICRFDQGAADIYSQSIGTAATLPTLSSTPMISPPSWERMSTLLYPSSSTALTQNQPEPNTTNSASNYVMIYHPTPLLSPHLVNKNFDPDNGTELETGSDSLAPDTDFFFFEKPPTVNPWNILVSL